MLDCRCIAVVVVVLICVRLMDFAFARIVGIARRLMRTEGKGIVFVEIGERYLCCMKWLQNVTG